MPPGRGRRSTPPGPRRASSAREDRRRRADGRRSPAGVHARAVPPGPTLRSSPPCPRWRTRARWQRREGRVRQSETPRRIDGWRPPPVRPPGRRGRAAGAAARHAPRPHGRRTDAAAGSAPASRPHRHERAGTRAAGAPPPPPLRRTAPPPRGTSCPGARCPGGRCARRPQGPVDERGPPASGAGGRQGQLALRGDHGGSGLVRRPGPGVEQHAGPVVCDGA